eukprot:1842581-Amphidinium_carterae.1
MEMASSDSETSTRSVSMWGRGEDKTKGLGTLSISKATRESSNIPLRENKQKVARLILGICTCYATCQKHALMNVARRDDKHVYGQIWARPS